MFSRASTAVTRLTAGVTLALCTFALGTLAPCALAHAPGAKPASATREVDPFVGRRTPPFRVEAMNGQEISLPAALGRYVLLVFSDEKSRMEVRAFLAHNAARLAGIRNLAVYHFHVPGHILIPRAIWLHKARADTLKTLTEARGGLMERQLAGFDALDIRWCADFNRQVSGFFDAPPAVVSLVLVDPNGYIAAREPDTEEPAMHRILSILKEGRLAPGSNPPRELTTVSPTDAGTAARHRVAKRLGLKARKKQRNPEDEELREEPETVAEPQPEPRDEGAAVGPARPPHGASTKKNRYLY